MYLRLKGFLETIGLGFGAVVGFVILIVVVVALAWGGELAYYKFIAPTSNTLQYQAIKHSQTFVQGHNDMAQSYIDQYNSAVAAGDQAHANADKDAACVAAGDLNADERIDSVAAFYSQHCS